MLTTEHLLLRAYQSSDDANILELYDTPAVQLTMTNHLNTPLGTDFIEAVFRPSTKSAYFHSIITLRSDPSVFVGVVFLEHFDNAKDRSAMYSLAVLQAHQGKWYGTEVTKVVVDWGFRMGGLHRMWLSASECNLGAIRVYEKACVCFDIFFQLWKADEIFLQRFPEGLGSAPGELGERSMVGLYLHVSP